MNQILFYYFKPNERDFYIFLEYFYEEKENKLCLESLRFFKTESAIKEHIQQKKSISSGKKNLQNKKLIKQLVRLLNDYLNGKVKDLYQEVQGLGIDLNLDDKFSTQFSRKVLQILLTIKPGKVMSYSNVANRINSKAYRAVGNILRNNDLPLIIPCHRVIRKNGTLGGFGGETGENWRTNIKQDLIKLEQKID
ncbi:MAG: putative Methylated-DNA--protein-cysteine methyltransferase, constitutive [Promethearchaeota archaeon]|nr:MAG: putative Methylated-DNA--protein-cysteine methyltransferase, constitutive [Candidatus Lokiarchaeota archaeon]